MMSRQPCGFNVENVDIEESLSRVAAVIGEEPRLVVTRSGQPWVGLTTHCAVHIAYDERTRNRIKEEAARLQWAARQGIPVPRVRESGPDWLVTERAVNDGVTGGRRYVEAAVAAARAINRATEPPPSVRGPLPRHGGGYWSGLVRLSRIVRSPLSPLEFRQARKAAAALPPGGLAHGDFVLHNILFDASRGTVTVIDWEFLRYAPAHFDLLVLWPRLAAAEDREVVMEAVLSTTQDRRAVGVLHHWLSVRLLADLVTKAPPRAWARERVDEAVRRVAEARSNAAAWGA
jgi:aminoglycoside phosphotransferase